ncbi:MAG: class I SAM-dependent methyltransferase [Halobacteriota archaeon]
MRGYELLQRAMPRALTECEQTWIPRTWQILGDLVLVHVQPPVEHLKYLIGQGLLRLYPRCKSVLWDKGVLGTLREPDVEVIAGTETVTVHKENHCKFALDARRVMFSAGNFAERLRMSTVGEGEDVLDMFSGVGQLCIPLAFHARPRSVTAIELNPVAYEFLKQNIVLNNLTSVMQPVAGDCTQVVLNRRFDRVIMGHFNAYRYLKKGTELLRPGGVLHFHAVVPVEEMHDQPCNLIEETTRQTARLAEVLEVRKVKSYAPGIAHVVADVRVN